MENLNNNSSKLITNNLNELFEYVYKKKPSKYRRIDFNVLHITYPKQKVYKLDIKYLKNIKDLLSYFFANIDKKPFINRNYNIYAFEALWLLLGIIDKAHGYKYKKKELFTNIELMNNIGNTMKFGRYIFTIPKYKQFIFDVKGINMARLVIV